MQNQECYEEEIEIIADENTINTFDLSPNLYQWTSVTETFNDLKEEYGSFWGNVNWDDVNDWKKVICYIVENVILTPENNDETHQQHYQQAIYCLRLLETVDRNAVASLLQKIVKWKHEKNINKQRIQEIEALPGIIQWKRDFSIITHGLNINIEFIIDSFDPPHNPNYEYNDETKRRCHVHALKTLIRNKLKDNNLNEIFADIASIVDNDEDLPYYDDELKEDTDFAKEWVKLYKEDIRKKLMDKNANWHNYCVAYPDFPVNVF